MKTIYRGAGFIAVAFFLASATVQAAAPETLYQRLGEEPGIRYLVDTFIGKVASDHRINHFFKNANIPRLKKLVVAQLSQATGGPQKYTGKDMKTAHKGMHISNADFAAFVDDLVWAMNKISVGKNEQKQILAALGPMQKDIVEPPAEKPAAKPTAKKPAPKSKSKK